MFQCLDWLHDGGPFEFSLIYRTCITSTSESTSNPPHLLYSPSLVSNLMLHFHLFEFALHALIAWLNDLSLPTVCDYSLLIWIYLIKVIIYNLIKAVTSNLFLFMRTWVATDPNKFHLSIILRKNYTKYYKKYSVFKSSSLLECRCIVTAVLMKCIIVYIHFKMKLVVVKC